MPSQGDIELAFLKVLAGSGDNRPAQTYLKGRVISVFQERDRPTEYAVMQAFWALVSRGLVYIDMIGQSAENWSAFLTDAGRAALKDEELNPDLPTGYFTRTEELIPELSPVVWRYLTEAVNAYIARCYLASDVMLGVATEAAILDMAPSFARWLPASDGAKLKNILDSRQHFAKKLEEIQKRMAVHRNALPDELNSGLDAVLNWSIDLIRTNRNDAGHPTRRVGERSDTFIMLTAFPHVARRIYALRAFFNAVQDSTPERLTNG